MQLVVWNSINLGHVLTSGPVEFPRSGPTGVCPRSVSRFNYDPGTDLGGHRLFGGVAYNGFQSSIGGRSACQKKLHGVA